MSDFIIAGVGMIVLFALSGLLSVVLTALGLPGKYQAVVVPAMSFVILFGTVAALSRMALRSKK